MATPNEDSKLLNERIDTLLSTSRSQKELTPSEAQKIAKRYSTTIFDEQETLCGILKNQGAALCERWTTTTPEKRQKLLKQVTLYINEYHRPDLHVYRESGVKYMAESQNCQLCFLLPHLNIEDLKKPKTLLMWLDSRAWTHPHRFVLLDNESLGLSAKAGILKRRKFLTEYAMVLCDQDQKSGYGQLLPRSELDEEATHWNIEPEHGLFVLQWQRIVLNFLRCCAERIMEDKSLSHTHLSTNPAPPSINQYLIQNQTDPKSFSITEDIAEEPYRVPQGYNIRRVVLLLHARLGEAKVDLGLLRDCPDYLRDSVYEQSEHQNERLRGKQGEVYPTLGTDGFWQRVHKFVVDNAIIAVFRWNDLAALATRLSVLEEKRIAAQEASHDPSQLPSDFEPAFRLLRDSLIESMDFWRAYYSLALNASPPMRHRYFWHGNVNPNDPIIPHRSRYLIDEGKDPLLWFLRLLAKREEHNLFAVHTLLDEVERIISKTPSDQAWISPRIARYLSDLSILAECQRQVELLGETLQISTDLSNNEREAADKNYKLFEQISGLVWNVNDPLTAGSPLNHITGANSNTSTIEIDHGNLWKAIDEKCLKKKGTSTPHSIPAQPTEATAKVFTFLFEKVEKRNSVVYIDNIPGIGVSKSGMRVIKALFGTGSEGGLSPEITWEKFLTAFQTMGFSALKMAGSAWVMKAPNDDDDCGIIFHEPREEKIPRYVARRFGLKLNRRYGWTRDAFHRN